MSKFKEKKSLGKRILLILRIVVEVILCITILINICRMFFIDKMNNIETYQYPNVVSIEYNGETYSRDSYIHSVNTYMYPLIIYRMSEDAALEIIDNPKMIIDIDNSRFYLSQDNKIVCAVHTQMIRKRSIVDKSIWAFLMDDSEYIYYSTKASEDHYEFFLGKFNAYKRYASEE